LFDTTISNTFRRNHFKVNLQREFNEKKFWITKKR